MAESTRLKLFQKLIKAYTEAHEEKSGKDVQLEVSAEWKEMTLKDSNLEVAVEKKISELKQLSTKKNVRSMAMWSKFISGNAKKQHDQDVDEGEAAVIPAIPAPADNVC